MYRPTPFLLTLIALLAFLPAPRHLAAAGEDVPSAFHDRDLAVMRLSSPQQFALLLHEPEEAPRLYRVGDLLGGAGGAAGLLEVERIERERLVLRDRGTGRRWSLQPNQVTPVGEGLVFLGTVSLTEIQYRFEASHLVMEQAPVVLSVAGSRAVLIQQVPSIRAEGRTPRARAVPPPDPEGRRDRATASAGSATGIEGGTYEVDRSALAPTVEKLRKKLARGLSDITQAVLTRNALLPVETSVGNGVLTKTGFTVTQPKVARTFGIEVGDTIVALNGRPVSSPLNAYWTFQEVFIRGKTKTLRVDLVRSGRPLTHTYTIR